MRTHTQPWLRTVPKPARRVIRDIMKREESDSGHGRHKKDPGRWWVRLSPTTRTATEVTLLRKQENGQTKEYPIMRKGELV